MKEETKTTPTKHEESKSNCSIKALLDRETVDELLSAKVTTGG